MKRDGTRSITFTVPIKTVSHGNGGNGSHGHWAVKARRAKEHKEAAMLAATANLERAEMQFPCIVLLTRLSVGTLDDDNLRQSLKACRDGIAKALGVDDKDVTRVRYQYEQERCKRAEAGVRVTIISGARLHETLELL